MWDIFRSIGVIDKIKEKGSLKQYARKLHHYQENEADVLIDMGLLYFEDEKYDESLYHLKKAANIYQSLYELESEAFVNDLMGDVYLSTREMDNALNRYRKAFKLYSSAKSKMKDEILEKIKEVEDIKEAIELANAEKMEEFSEFSFTQEEKMDDSEIDDGKKLTYTCYLNYERISSTMEKIMKLLGKKYKIKEPSKAEYESGYFQKSIFDTHKDGNINKEAVMLLILSNFLMKENKPFSAMQNLKTAFDLSHQSGYKELEAYSLLFLGIVYYLLGKEKKIYGIFKNSIRIFKEIKYKEGENIAIDIINTLYSEDECFYIEDT